MDVLLACMYSITGVHCLNRPEEVDRPLVTGVIVVNHKVGVGN